MQIHIRVSLIMGRNTGWRDSSRLTKNLAYLPSLFSLYTPLLFLPKKMLILSFSCSFGPFWPICPPQADPSWDILDMHACRQIYICNLDFSSPGNILAQQDTIFVCHWRITLWFLWTGFWFVTIFTGYSGLFQWLK